MKQDTSKRGFTLIEVVIVLAIASIIILVVLNTVTHAKKAQRDNNRKQQAAQLVAAFSTYASNNGGNYAGFSCASYCGSLNDIDNTTGKPVAGSAGVSATKTSGITYVTGAICGSGGSAGSAVADPGNSFTVLYWSDLTNSSLCIDQSGASSVADAGGGAGFSTAGGDGVGGAGTGGGTGAYAVNGGNTASCLPDNTRCMKYPGGGIYTAWSPTEFTYDISTIMSGSHNMKIYYRNTSPLPASYSNFNINIYIDGVKVVTGQQFPIQTTGYAAGPIAVPINVPAGAKNMAVEWTNDWCCGPNGQDANFVLNSFTIQ